MYSVDFLGTTFHIDPVAISIGSFEVYWYGIIIATGFLAALIYGFRRANDLGLSADPMIDIIMIGTIGAVVGARAYYVLTTLERYSSFGEMIDLRNGGLAIYGGIIGAFVCGGLACKWRKVNVLNMFDLGALAFPIGQAVGRFGNFMNQEAFGSNTTLPWGMYSNETYQYLSSVQSSLETQGVTVDPSLPVHPCFLYESLWCIIGFVLLHYLSKKRRFYGQTLLQYIVWYGFGRFFIEWVRTDSLMIGPFKISQVIAVVCVLIGTTLLIVIGKKTKDKSQII